MLYVGKSVKDSDVNTEEKYELKHSAIFKSFAFFRAMYSVQSFAHPRRLAFLYKDFFLLHNLINSFVIQGA